MKHFEFSPYLDAIDRLVRKACAHLQGNLDEEQIELYDLAFVQAEILAARTLIEQAELASELETPCRYFCANAIVSITQKLAVRPQTFGLTAAELPSLEPLQDCLSPQAIAALGEHYLDQGLAADLLDDEKRIIRDTFKDFADQVVKPLAEEVHRKDLLVPAEILEPLKEMGVFGLSVPERFGGLKPDTTEDSMGMVIVTEELSRGSLGAAGSLITRPEIMARALLEGGTEEQQARWLPQIASGQTLCAVSVTEPNTGSDVASVALKATKTDGGWRLNGGKTWCTYAGAAGALLVLARTDADAKPAHKGLSLFVVEKPSYDGHHFDYQQAEGGRMTGRAIPTLGYRGMHSFEMAYEDFFVPDDCLIGGEAGQGKGFYFTMRGFMGGRLQTAARACGLMRAAFEESVSYSQDRMVFGRSVASYPLSLAKLARMGALITACKAFTAHVAGLMDQGLGQMEASLVKLFSCRAAEWVTRESVQLHGGMGYAEEVAVSRYFADARVLSIFEGAEETLAIRVVGKTLVDQARN
ncbi:MAG: acyl-CoA/acyl-ACP dehydrogenase [Pseudomonadales bacterium]|nr:acyl-CoA/acyl-ACP dehydrogenase [Pseudomonadales bacterium]